MADYGYDPNDPDNSGLERANKALRDVEHARMTRHSDWLMQVDVSLPIDDIRKSWQEYKMTHPLDGEDQPIGAAALGDGLTEDELVDYTQIRGESPQAVENSVDNDDEPVALLGVVRPDSTTLYDTTVTFSGVDSEIIDILTGKGNFTVEKVPNGTISKDYWHTLPYARGGVKDEAPEKPERSKALAEADALINGDRQEEYGTPQVNFQRIVDMWNVLLPGRNWTRGDVALALLGLKMARAAQGYKRDTYIDIAGYAGLAVELNETEDE